MLLFNTYVVPTVFIQKQNNEILNFFKYINFSPHISLDQKTMRYQFCIAHAENKIFMFQPNLHMIPEMSIQQLTYHLWFIIMINTEFTISHQHINSYTHTTNFMLWLIRRGMMPGLIIIIYTCGNYIFISYLVFP